MRSLTRSVLFVKESLLGFQELAQRPNSHAAHNASTSTKQCNKHDWSSVFRRVDAVACNDVLGSSLVTSVLLHVFAHHNHL